MRTQNSGLNTDLFKVMDNLVGNIHMSDKFAKMEVTLYIDRTIENKVVLELLAERIQTILDHMSVQGISVHKSDLINQFMHMISTAAKHMEVDK